MVALQNTINAIRVAAADDPIYQQLKRQIAVGWPPTSAELTPELKPYHSFADELAVCGEFVFKGHRVVVPLSYRDAILDRLQSVHITGSAVALQCVKAHRQSQCISQNFNPL